DVGHLSAERIVLVLLEDGRMCGAAVEDDVEDRVQPAGAGQRPAQLALGDRDRVRLGVVPVENPRHETLAPQAPSLARACRLTRLYLELDPFAGHIGGQV